MQPLQVRRLVKHKAHNLGSALGKLMDQKGVRSAHKTQTRRETE